MRGLSFLFIMMASIAIANSSDDKAALPDKCKELIEILAKTETRTFTPKKSLSDFESQARVTLEDHVHDYEEGIMEWLKIRPMLRSMREARLRFYSNLQGNKGHTIFFKQVDGSMATIKAVRDSFLEKPQGQFTAEDMDKALLDAKKWVQEFEDYPKKSLDAYTNYSILKHIRHDLKNVVWPIVKKRKARNFDASQTFTVIVEKKGPNGSPVKKTYTFTYKRSYHKQLREVNAEIAKLEGKRTWFSTKPENFGTLRNLDYQQAILERRLINLNEALTDILSSNFGRKADRLKEAEELLDKIQTLLASQDHNTPLRGSDDLLSVEKATERVELLKQQISNNPIYASARDSLKKMSTADQAAAGEGTTGDNTLVKKLFMFVFNDKSIHYLYPTLIGGGLTVLTVPFDDPDHPAYTFVLIFKSIFEWYKRHQIARDKCITESEIPPLAAPDEKFDKCFREYVQTHFKTTYDLIGPSESGYYQVRQFGNRVNAAYMQYIEEAYNDTREMRNTFVKNQRIKDSTVQKAAVRQIDVSSKEGDDVPVVTEDSDPFVDQLFQRENSNVEKQYKDDPIE